MEKTWRWYGPDDPVSLNDIKQSGSTGIVTALHHIKNGDVWTKEDILIRKNLIESKGLTWTVVESVPVHEEIKLASGNYLNYINNYKKTIINLAECGINTVCYNFMPILDWTRTDLYYELSDGSRTLRFDQIAFAAFELFILKRNNSEKDYTEQEKIEALIYFNKMTKADVDKLTSTIIAGLPGAEEGYTLEQFQQQLSRYNNTDKEKLRKNLAFFLNELTPICEKVGLNLAIHPDDPPRPICGLPRIMSTIDDIEWLRSTVPSPANGLTVCTGSLGVSADNDLVDIIKKYGSYIYFLHLRSTQRESNSSSFHEASHINGDIDMYDIVKAVLKEENKRETTTASFQIPMRPDHGHQILDDLKKEINPGYSAIGRLKGLAEIRGMEMAIKRELAQQMKDKSYEY